MIIRSVSYLSIFFLGLDSTATYQHSCSVFDKVRYYSNRGIFDIVSAAELCEGDFSDRYVQKIFIVRKSQDISTVTSKTPVLYTSYSLKRDPFRISWVSKNTAIIVYTDSVSRLEQGLIPAGLTITLRKE